MKTTSIIFSFFLIALVLYACAIEIVDYLKTKDDAVISPSELKELKKRNLKLTLLVGIFVIFDHVCRYLD